LYARFDLCYNTYHLLLRKEESCMDQMFGQPLDMRGLKIVYYGMLAGLFAFLFQGIPNLIISFGKFILMAYGLFQLCKTDMRYRTSWNFCWACLSFSVIDLGITLWFVFTQTPYPWWLLVIMGIASTGLYVLYIRSLCKATALLARETVMGPQLEPIIWSRWKWLWISQVVYIAVYILYAFGIRYQFANLAVAVQFLSVATLLVMTWVIAMFNACYMALHGQQRILSSSDYTIESGEHKS
jgi:phosphoglycerol transferase MdoB-like AlkP superfamily enzyme